MLWLVQAIRGIILRVIDWLGFQNGLRVVLVGAAIAAYIAVTGVFIAAMNGFLSAAIMAMPAWAASGAAVFAPTNAGTVFVIIASAEAAGWVYRYAVAHIKLAHS